jgi:leader peptidase (prepilin peptidase)/N-methyltransferase
MVACGLVAAAVGPTLVLPLFVALTVLGVALGAIDVACKRLPHDLVIPAIWIGGMWLTVVAAITGDWNALLRAAFGAAVLGALYFVLFLVPGQGMGFGDVKLAVLLGGFLGWLGWPEVILGVLVPWLLNGPVVLVLLLTGRVNRKTTLPFGPAMLAGAWVSIVLGSWLNLFGRV